MSLKATPLYVFPADSGNSMKIRQWIWIPTVVCLLGIFSIILLLLSHRIHERQHHDFDNLDTIMNTQITTATAHLWLEHILSGDEGVEDKQVIADLDKAIKLIDVILKNGHTEHDFFFGPLKNPALHTQAEEIKSLLVELKMSSLERLQSPETSGMGSATDRKFNALFIKVLNKAGVLEDIMKINAAKNEERFNRFFLAVLIIWIFIVISATARLFSLESKRRKIGTELRTTNVQLQLQADELTEHRERLEGLVNNRTAELKAAHERIHDEMAERLKARVNLHEAGKLNLALSNKLLTAQEAERKRISMELHDGLGQALNVMKLQLRVIEKGSKASQGAMREEYEKLLEYMDQTIEEVRRISMDLSPAILEEFGLKSALQLLLSNLKRDLNLMISEDIDYIDRLFPEKHWIIIYRVIQEALTNIVKHAQAENVSFLARRQEQRVIFSVEDDGKGFDLEPVLAQGPPEKGLGLTTMRQRVKIMGGDFNLWSRKGMGTRITFSIPVENNEA
jgi:signal transduction histidine kinase